jgi:Ni/Co efflux regulator RcnB
MRKLILLTAMAAIMVPSAGVAQRQDRRDRVEVRKDRQEVRRDRRELRRDRNEMRRDRRDVRQDRRVRRSAYVAPVRNWSYRPVSVGFRLQPSFYGPRYYISDYSTYRLQAPRHRWLRWVRYGDDLLLVNIRNGRVLNVVHYRYW